MGESSSNLWQPEAQAAALGYEVTTEKARIDTEAVHAFLTATYWAKGIPLDLVRRSIDHSACAAVLRDGTTVGFARVITDHATFAYLADVFVLPDHRGQGLSRWMLDALLAKHSLRSLRRVLLFTRDAHDLYRKYGFTGLNDPTRVMVLDHPNPYAARS